MDGRKVCQKDCPNRSVECRLTCEAYKAYAEKKREEYRARQIAATSYPDKLDMTRQYKKKCRVKLTRG